MDILMAFSVKKEAGTSSTSSDTSDSSSGSQGPRVHFHLENTDEAFGSASFCSHIASHNEVQLEHCGSARWANYFKVAFKVSEHIMSAALLSSLA